MRNNTTFIQEMGPRPELKVQLVLNEAEIFALMALAQAAIDASVMMPDAMEDLTAQNAQIVFEWATAVYKALHTTNTDNTSNAEE